MSDHSSFDSVMARLAAHDEGAARQVVERFARRLAALTRGHLSPLLRSKVDAEDVVQSVFLSFFRRQEDQPFDFAGWDGLWALLTLLTVRKCARHAQRFATGGRDARREVAALAAEGDSATGWEIPAREPTPEEALMLTETVEKVLAELKERERPIVVLGLQGFTAPEISAQTGRSERTVYRVLHTVRKKLEALHAQGLQE